MNLINYIMSFFIGKDKPLDPIGDPKSTVKADYLEDKPLPPWGPQGPRRPLK